MKYLPCGHDPTTEAHFEEQVRNLPALMQGLIRDLQRKRWTPPGGTRSYIKERVVQVKAHFELLCSRLPTPCYLQQVDLYKKASQKHLRGPLCRQARMPLLPDAVPGLLQEADLPTPRTGGRLPSREIENRNRLIANLKQGGKTHHEICRILDQQRLPVPPRWKKEKIATWKEAYRDRQKLPRLHSLFSKAASR